MSRKYALWEAPLIAGAQQMTTTALVTAAAHPEPHHSMSAPSMAVSVLNNTAPCFSAPPFTDS